LLTHDIHIEKCDHCNRVFIRLKHGEYQRDRWYYWMIESDRTISGNPIHGNKHKQILL